MNRNFITTDPFHYGHQTKSVALEGPAESLVAGHHQWIVTHQRIRPVPVLEVGKSEFFIVEGEPFASAIHVIIFAVYGVRYADVLLLVSAVARG